jgi:hypothetical protein
MEEVFTERAKEILLQAAHTPLDGYTASNSVKVRMLHHAREKQRRYIETSARKLLLRRLPYVSRKSVVILNRTVTIT